MAGAIAIDVTNQGHASDSADPFVEGISELLAVLSRAKRAELVTTGILVGILAGCATDAILTAGGA
ncbi:MAG TPA: hypothetical protein VN108_04180 [Marmoricola sp.]|nr:hypothetical protein [Marmoricola sp.]